jgi:hypothetical protein
MLFFDRLFVIGFWEGNFSDVNNFCKFFSSHRQILPIESQLAQPPLIFMTRNSSRQKHLHKNLHERVF